LGVTILEIVNIPVLRLAHFFSPFAFSPISTSRRMASEPDQRIGLRIEKQKPARLTIARALLSFPSRRIANETNGLGRLNPDSGYPIRIAGLPPAFAARF
jgi:hypothetical protein